MEQEVDKKGQKRSVDDKNKNDNNASKQTLFKGKFRGFKKHTRLFATSEQVKGFLVACEKARDSQSISETMDLLHWYALKFLPEFKESVVINTQQHQQLKEQKEKEKRDKQQQATSNNNNDKVDDDDEEEEAELVKNENGELIQTRKRFELINSACGGLYIISITQEDVNPVDFGSAIIIDLYNRFKNVHTYEDETSKQDRFKDSNIPQSVKTMLANAKKDEDLPKPSKNIFNIKFTFRLIPFQRSTQTVMVDFIPVISKLIQNALENDTKSTFSIEYRTRNSHTCGKTEVIESVAKMLTNKVDLSNPDVTIIVEIIKSAICMSVVRGFKSLFKFNIREVIYGNEHRFKRQKEMMEKENQGEAAVQIIEKNESSVLIPDTRDNNNNNEQPKKKQKN